MFLRIFFLTVLSLPLHAMHESESLDTIIRDEFHDATVKPIEQYFKEHSIELEKKETIELAEYLNKITNDEMTKILCQGKITLQGKNRCFDAIDDFKKSVNELLVQHTRR